MGDLIAESDLFLAIIRLRNIGNLWLVKCCDCNLEEMIKDTVMKNSSITMEKRQMHDDEDDSAEMMVESDTTEGATTNVKHATESPGHKSTETSENYKNECMFYKELSKFHFENMADVWKITYYKTAEKLSCFKIHIKKTTMQNRKILHDKYGDFNGTIDWKNCQFEVASSAQKNGRSDRRHFLQGSKEDKGVFSNIILTADEHGNMTLLEQSPDQWLVVNHLLLMRDCDNGDVVVFSRLPIEPSDRDIEDALTSFGEDASNGTLACETLRGPKFQTLS